MDYRSPYSIDWQSPISGHPLNSKLEAWWLNVPHWQGGTVWRDMVRGIAGSFVNYTNSVWETPGRTGGWGRLELPSADGYVDCGDQDALIGDGYSYSFWCRTPTVTGIAGMLSKMNSGTTAGMLFLRVNDEFQVYTDSGSTDASISFFSTNTWHFATVTLDGTNARIYKDGVLVETGTDNAASSNNELFLIGVQNYFDARDWQGGMDDIRVYSRVLSSAEVRDLYHRSRDFNRGLLRQIVAPGVKAPAAPASGTPYYYNWRRRTA